MNPYSRIILRCVSCCAAVLFSLFFLIGYGEVSADSGPDGYGYVSGFTNYDWVEISSSGTEILLADLDSAGPLPLGFPFSFYGIHWSEFYVSSMGYISFGSGSFYMGNQCPLPDAAAPDNFIALMWDDLDPSVTNDPVYYESFTAGSCPYLGYIGNCLVVQYEDFCHWPGGVGCNSAGTFEAILFDNNDIILQFKDAGDEEGSGSTTGIEGSSTGHGLSYACNTANSLSNGLAIEFTSGSYLLSPVAVLASSCVGKTDVLEFELSTHAMGDSTSFSLSYAISSGDGTISGPASLTVADNSTESLQVNLTASPSGQVGDVVTATVTATGAGRTSISTISMTVTTGVFQRIADEPDGGRAFPMVAVYDNIIWSIGGDTMSPAAASVRTYNPKSDTWADISDSISPGNGKMHSSCQVGARVYVSPDDGLWAYDMASNEYLDLTVLPGHPDVGNSDLEKGAWAYDPETGYCYITGGEHPTSHDDLSSVFVFNPSTQQWLAPLASFEHGRTYHAAWVTGSGEDKKLGYAGGMVDSSGLVSPEEKNARQKTTQCYSFAEAMWKDENTDLGPLPEPLAAMGYTKRRACDFSEELWLTGGAVTGCGEGCTTEKTWYYDPLLETWMTGPVLSTPSAACGLVNYNNELYKISGLNVDMTDSTGLSERLMICRACFPWPMFMPAIIGAEGPLEQ